MTTTSAMFIIPVLYYPYSEQLYNKKQLSSATVCAVYAASREKAWSKIKKMGS